MKRYNEIRFGDLYRTLFHSENWENVFQLDKIRSLIFRFQPCQTLYKKTFFTDLKRNTCADHQVASGIGSCFFLLMASEKAPKTVNIIWWFYLLNFYTNFKLANRSDNAVDSSSEKEIRQRLLKAWDEYR